MFCGGGKVYRQALWRGARMFLWRDITSPGSRLLGQGHLRVKRLRKEKGKQGVMEGITSPGSRLLGQGHLWVKSLRKDKGKQGSPVNRFGPRENRGGVVL